jgi:hypothetical protein
VDLTSITSCKSCLCFLGSQYLEKKGHTSDRCAQQCQEYYDIMLCGTTPYCAMGCLLASNNASAVDGFDAMTCGHWLQALLRCIQVLSFILAGREIPVLANVSI